MPVTDNIKHLEDELRRRLESECIQLLEAAIVKLNRKHFDPATDSAKVKEYDGKIDKLSSCLRKIVREGISADTKEFLAHTNSLKKSNRELFDTINHLDKIAETLKALVNFVAVVEKIVKLVPRPAL